MPITSRALALTVPALALPLLAGCAAPGAAGSDTGLSVVASTSVYGAIAEVVAGGGATVTSIISAGNSDPHGYEATARDQLTLARADLVVQNGGGYDPFVAELLETAGSDAILLSAVEDGEAAAHDSGEAEHHHEHGENEHVWYSLHAMEELAGRIGNALAELDAANADTYRDNAAEFSAGIEALEARAHELGERFDGSTALATEPVPLLLVEEAGIDDVTPVEFLAAIEDERDVPPAVLAETLELIAAGGVDLVAFNRQTVDATSTRLVEAAEAGGVPVADFTELPPEEVGYLDWMERNLNAIEEALE
jgi:zinc/manganese transport system substrate-binding protein